MRECIIPAIGPDYEMADMGVIWDDIVTERVRQEQMHEYTCASPNKSFAEKLAILVEECGEVATEVNDGRPFECREELVQVAAVAVAWIQAIDEGQLR